MSEKHSFDVLIIGGGQAGIPLAYALAKAGQSVALAERKNLGGSCVNFGCTPTKAAIASAHVAHQARRGAVFGLRIPVVEVDFPAVLERARSILMESRRGLERDFEGSDNPRLLHGHARLEGREGKTFRARVGDRRITARQVVLDTGTRTDIPPVEGLEDIDFLHAGNWLEKPELPEHLAIIGGGYIGLEMGQFYRRMGSRVTVLEQSARIAKHEDPDVRETLQSLLEADGIEFRLSTRIERVRTRAGGVSLSQRQRAGSSELQASHLFVATGRKPNTDDLGLKTLGVKVSREGIVETSNRLATSVKGVWAAGDIRGGPMFTHTSWDDYRVLESQMTGDGSRTTERVVPYAIYTDPELGRVGLTERDARKEGKKLRIGRFEMKKNGKARERSETEGLVKVVAEAASRRILGAAVLSAEGAELVHVFVDLMSAKAPYTVLRDAVYIHPTLAEAVQSAVASLP